MPPQTQASGLMKKLGESGRRAFDKVKGNETKFDSGGGLPAGIENGIARLVSCKFGVYENGDTKGEFFFSATGIVLTPDDHDGTPVRGLRTTIGPEPMCSTPTRSRKTIDEHMDWVLNVFRQFGVDTNEIGADELEATAAALQETAPCFRFRTWKGKPATEGKYKDMEPRVQHVWNGVVDYEQPVGDSETVDETPVVAVVTPKAAPKQAVAVKVAPTRATLVRKELPDYTQMTVQQLVEASDDQNEEAQAALKERALSVMTEDEYDATESFGELGSLIEVKMSESLESTTLEVYEWAPVKGEIHDCTPIDAKSKKPGKKVEVEITKVNPKLKTVDCHLVGDPKKVYTGVAWSLLG